MGNRMPKSRVEFWRKKLKGNKKRDAQIEAQLRSAGWSVLVIWECQTTNAILPQLSQQIETFLDSSPMSKDARKHGKRPTFNQ
jgi:DNA mismatch endonuclease (patch repair protein)